MKPLVFIVSILLCTNLFAQGYFLSKEGTKIFYTGRDNGKFCGRVELSLSKKQDDKIIVTLDSYDKNNKLETHTPLERIIEYKNGKLVNPELIQILSITSELLTKELFAQDQVSEYNPSFTLEGDAWLLPENTQVGTALCDQVVRFSALGMNFMTIKTTNAKVIGKDTLIINNKSIPCLIIESNRDFSFVLTREKNRVKEWYGLDYGPLKFEAYDKKSNIVYTVNVTDIQ